MLAPVRLICWGFPAALSENVMLPDCVPRAVGVKVTLIVHVPFTASDDGLAGQLFVWVYCALATMLAMFIAALPELVSVTVCAELVVFRI